MDVTVNPGNMHDSVAFDELYNKLVEHYPEIKAVFADAKEKYSMRYTLYRGLTQVANWVRLKFAAMNLKKYAIHKCKKDLHDVFILAISIIFNVNVKKTPDFALNQGFSTD